MSTQYEPGVCNIGRGEQFQRYVYAALAGVAAVAYVAVVVLLNVPSALLAGVFVPLALAVEWAVQARTAFCVRFALLGQYDTGDGGGEVDSRDARREDIRQSVRITVLSMVIAAAMTAAVYLLLA